MNPQSDLVENILLVFVHQSEESFATNPPFNGRSLDPLRVPAAGARRRLQPGCTLPQDARDL
eukprot:scaffold139427_cov148-Phaeocystis_antarctica.AAC.1